MTQKILVLPGEGIGPEITAEAVKVLDVCRVQGLDVTLEEGLVGGAGYFRSAGLERLLRDARAGHYHPMQPKRQHVFSGRFALGLDPVRASS